MREHRDTNVGMGMVPDYDSPLEREVERLRSLLRIQTEARKLISAQRDELLEAAKAAVHAWEIWAGMQPQNDDIESLEWGEFRRLRNAIAKVTPAEQNGVKS